MQIVQKVKEVKNEEIFSGNDKEVRYYGCLNT
jgi:hypothetical protein